jgi:energy-coupling factor transport system ATP-binding protein
VIDIDRFSFTYPGVDVPALVDVDLHIAEGELALVVGATGSGKTTLLRAVNGLVPHFTGGHVEGHVRVHGLDTRDHPPRELADVVGVVGQDPLASFVTDTVEEELAYGMEQLAVPADVMRRRVEETLDLMGIAGLRRRALRTLSGGEQQRVAIGAVLTMNPRVLVLDEPTSALDPAAAEETLAAILRLVHDLGVTALLAEHRLERVCEYADTLVVVESASVTSGLPAEMLRTTRIAPPVVELGRLAGWEPLPLSVRDARRRAGSLRERLAGQQPPPSGGAAGPATDGLVADGIVVRHSSTLAVNAVDVAVAPGEVVALMGRNGSGKSSLLWALHGAGSRAAGRVRLSNRDLRGLGRGELAALVALVPQQATDLLYHDSIGAECAVADVSAQAEPGTTRRRFDVIADSFAITGDTHPRDLSEGQRLALAIAVQLAAGPRVLLLDEPTRGLDYSAKHRLGELLAGMAGDGHALLVATHDVEFVARVAHRVVVLADGDVVTDAPVEEAIASSPLFAPQVAKVLAPQRWITVSQVRDALAAPEAVPRG